MGTQVLKDCKIYLAKYDLSGDHNEIEIKASKDKQKDTAFGDDADTFVPGLEKAEVSGGGYWQGGTDAVDDVLWSKMGSNDEVLTVGLIAGLDGEVARIIKALETSYEPGASVGEMFAFGLAAVGNKMVAATIMTDASAAKTATGNGTARNLGAVSATQKIYAALHVIAASGTTPTLNMTVESDDAQGFASPVTRLTFTQATAKTAEWKEAAGAITDTWWRAKWTIGGTTPSFTAICAVGII